MHIAYAMKTPLFHIVFTLVYFLTVRPGNRRSIEWQRMFFIFKVWLLKSFLLSSSSLGQVKVRKFVQVRKFQRQEGFCWSSYYMKLHKARRGLKGDSTPYLGNPKLKPLWNSIELDTGTGAGQSLLIKVVYLALLLLPNFFNQFTHIFVFRLPCILLSNRDPRVTTWPSLTILQGGD